MALNGLLALCAWLGLCAPALATIVVFGHHQGLSGQGQARPGDEVAIYSVRLVNDGASTLQSVAITVADLSTPTGIGPPAFSHLRLYRSHDALFDAGSDSLVGSQSVVNVGAPTTVSLSTPLTWSSGFPYFIVTATLNPFHADEAGATKDAFRVGSAGGAIATSDGGIGSAIVAEDANRITIDVVATQIVFATLPWDPGAVNGDVVNGKAFALQPVLEARDGQGNVDVEANGSVEVGVF